MLPSSRSTHGMRALKRHTRPDELTIQTHSTIAGAVATASESMSSGKKLYPTTGHPPRDIAAGCRLCRRCMRRRASDWQAGRREASRVLSIHAAHFPGLHTAHSCHAGVGRRPRRANDIAGLFIQRRLADMAGQAWRRQRPTRTTVSALTADDDALRVAARGHGCSSCDAAVCHGRFFAAMAFSSALFPIAMCGLM